MSQNKIYAAVFSDGAIKFYNHWPDCQKEVTGVSGVKFKGFPARDMAQSWVNLQAGKVPQSENTDQMIIYLDGSFTPKCPKAGWAWAAVKGGVLLIEKYGVTKHDALSRNIDGELEAARQAISWMRKNRIPAVLRYDYSGIENWATGAWKANSTVAKAYLKDVLPMDNSIQFEKVAGHSGDQWNDYVDELAKKAIAEYLASNKKLSLN